MASVTLRGLPMMADPAVPGSGLWQTSAVKLYDVCEPTKLMLRCLSATFTPSQMSFLPQYGSAAQNALDPSPAFSGARTGLTAEGPFIRYTIGSGRVDLKSRRTRTDNFAKVNGLYSPSSLVFIFDAAQNRPICLPYAGSVELITQYPGVWEYEYVCFGWDANQVSPIESETTLTLQLRDDSVLVPKNRVFGVPVGAHSLTYRDSHTTDVLWPRITVQTDDTPRSRVLTGAGALTTGAILRDAFGASQQFYGRVGLGNARTIRIDGIDSVDGQGEACFHISLV